MVIGRNNAVSVLPTDGSAAMPIPMSIDKIWPNEEFMSFIGDGKELVLPRGGKLQIFDVTDNIRPTQAIPAERRATFAAPPNGREIVVAYGYSSVDGVLRVFDLQGNLLRSLRGPGIVPEKPSTPPAVIAASASTSWTARLSHRRS